MKGNLQLVRTKVSGYMNHVLNNTAAYKCDNCGKSFARDGILKKHIKACKGIEDQKMSFKKAFWSFI